MEMLVAKTRSLFSTLGKSEKKWQKTGTQPKQIAYTPAADVYYTRQTDVIGRLCGFLNRNPVAVDTFCGRSAVAVHLQDFFG
jgi:hypothetical protein